MGSHPRVHYMDNLRAFAMLLGVFFHAALAYSPLLTNVWLTADPQQSPVVDFLAFFSHTFRMPLFFIVAGFFAAMMLRKRQVAGLLKNRSLRILTPFILFLPLMWIAFVLVIGWAIETVQAPSSMLGLIKMMAQNPDAPAPPLTTAHLWFLYQLIFFYVLAAIGVKTIKLDWMTFVAKSPLAFVLLAPLLLVPALASQHAPTPAPEQFIPQLWSFGFYGLFFVLGWGLFARQDFIVKLQPFMIWMLVMGTAAYSAFFMMMPETVSMQDAMIQATQTPELTPRHLLMVILEGISALYMSLGLLLLGQRFFDKQNKPVRFIADASYWIYIIHLPVLWAIQFLLLDTEYGLVTEFLISSVGTIAIGLLSYILFVRWTPIGWMLNGKKKQQNVEDHSDQRSQPTLIKTDQ